MMIIQCFYHVYVVAFNMMVIHLLLPLHPVRGVPYRMYLSQITSVVKYVIGKWFFFNINLVYDTNVLVNVKVCFSLLGLGLIFLIHDLGMDFF